MSNNKQITPIDSLRMTLGGEYKKQIMNYFGNEPKALKFLSSVVSACQRNQELLKCETTSVINSFMTMAQLEFMPSDVSGEAYVLPYKGKAQFQLGYQGLITLFYRSGARAINAEIIHEKDKFVYKNGNIEHEPDIFSEDRGKAIGAYVIVELRDGGKVQKVMKKSDILNIGKKFSKSFNSDYSPWKEKNDPELWMWKKSVLKQVAKLVPKSEIITQAIAEDNKDSNIGERMAKVKEESNALKMGNLVKIQDPDVEKEVKESMSEEEIKEVFNEDQK